MKLNFPNFLIIIRLILVPIIISLLLVGFNGGSYISYGNSNIGTSIFLIVAGVLFLFASFTDWLDGYWSRKYDQITTFGKLFDPLADKVLVNSVLIIFSTQIGIMMTVFTIVFISRDILVDGLRMLLSSKGIVLSAKRLGKLKTLFQMIGLILMFFVFPLNNIVLWEKGLIMFPLFIGLFFSVWSGIDYYVMGFKEINKDDKKTV